MRGVVVFGIVPQFGFSVEALLTFEKTFEVIKLLFLSFWKQVRVLLSCASRRRGVGLDKSVDLMEEGLTQEVFLLLCLVLLQSCFVKLFIWLKLHSWNYVRIQLNFRSWFLQS